MKKNQFAPDELKTIASLAAQRLRPLRIEFDEAIPTGAAAADFVSRYILTWLKLAERHRLIGDYQHSKDIVVNASFAGLQTIARYRFLHISHRVNSVLLDWSDGRFDLVLADRELDPLRVLQLQTEGRRCVTCIMPPDDLSQYVHDRDPLSFCLHDLMHAYHFYSNPDWLKPQIGFARLIAESLARGDFEDLYGAPDFRQKFEYAYSDMNAHPVHLLKYMRAIIDLSAGDAQRGDDVWFKFAGRVPGAHGLNRESENIHDMQIVTDYLYQMGT